ncbi:Uncharacterised protein [Mycobacteroides abscessus subsp. abscessus]|nr:Uncharacterised protein [Mycobacteroides abscessus subsp. abscessus]
MPSVGVRVSGTGKFSSVLSWMADAPVVEHGYPIAWVMLVLGVVIAGAAALHFGDVLDADVALKSVALPGFLGVALTVLAMANKDTLIKVPADQLQGVSLDTGTGAIVVLAASIVAVLAGFALLMFDGHVYVPTRPRTSSRPVATRPAARSKPGKKKVAPKKKKKKVKKKVTKKPLAISAAEVDDPVTSEADDGDATEVFEVSEQVVYTGGSAGQPPIWLTHWCAQLPASLRSVLAVPGVPDGGPVLLLHPGGGVGPDDLISTMVRDEKPWLLDDLAYTSWEAGLSPILGELGKSYTVLELVREDEWLAPLMQAAGIATTSTRLESGRDVHGSYERHVRTIDLPVLIGAAVEESGLVLRFASRVGDSAVTWSQGLTALREEFAAAGANARHLRVVDSPEGGVELRFNDNEERVAIVKE